MSDANTVLRIAELDFDGIKTNLKEYLRSQSQFSDYDFEGSGLNILLDVLAYNTHYMAYYLNMVGNEMFLDSATLRNSVVSHAKNLNYVPNSVRGAIAKVNILATDPGGTQSTITLPAYTQFQSQQVDGINYTFVNLTAQTATRNVSTDTFTFNNVTIKQGEKLTYNVTVNGSNTKRRFVIPNPNIDTTTLLVSVQNSTLDSTKNTYVLSEDLTAANANSQIYFLEEDASEQFAIYFGDGYLGKNLSNGNIVQLTYLVSDGDAANKANSFTIVDNLGNPTISNVIVTSVSSAAAGSLKEGIDQIKFTAPKFYTTQNRAVTVNDYGTLLLKDYPNVQSVSVWGGEDNDPVQYGKIFIAMSPKAGYVVTNAEKLRIVDEIIKSRSVLTVTPEIVDPKYTYLKVVADIHYDSSKTTLTQEELKTLVRNTVLTYNTNDLGKFNSTFRFSKLQKQIDLTDTSFLSSDMKIEAQKRFEPTLNFAKNYDLDYNMPLRRGEYKNKLYSYPTFQILDNNGIVRSAYLEETPLSFTGVDAIELTNGGSGYTVAPTVTITGDGIGATAIAKIVNGVVSSIDIVNKGSNYTTAVVSISGTGTGASARAVLTGETGILRTFYVQNTTGEKIIINPDAGSINYKTGKVRLISFKPISIDTNPYYASDILTVNIEPDVNTITPLRDRILTIDGDDPVSIQITMDDQS